MGVDGIVVTLKEQRHEAAAIQFGISGFAGVLRVGLRVDGVLEGET